MTPAEQFQVDPEIAVERGSEEPALIVDVEGFEGPLDLLLMLARQQKVDLAKISILALADQYLAFIEAASQVRLELAADYLVMAAWLAYLKSRLLLPESSDAVGPSAEEMAAALALRLKRLEAIRGAAERLVARPQLERDVFRRGAPEPICHGTGASRYRLCLELCRDLGDGPRRVGGNPSARGICADLFAQADRPAERRNRARCGRDESRNEGGRGGPGMRSLAKQHEVIAHPRAMGGDYDRDAVPEIRPEELRLLEALLFASAEPLDEKTLAARMPDGADVRAALDRLQREYASRGVNLVRIAGKWTFRTAVDLAWLLARDSVEPRKLSRAATETLAIIAYHQPVTRAEIEEIRGVSASRGTLDVLLETGWIRPRGRRKAPGRPITFGTTDAFLSHFGLDSIGDLPGLDELKGTGLLDGQLPAGFAVPVPSDDLNLREDEDPLEAGDLDLGLGPRLSEG